MTILSTTRMLTRYNAWANKVMFDAVAKLPEGEATKTRQTLFKNIVHTLNHNYVIDRIFQAHLEGREHGYTARNTTDHPPLEELVRAQNELDEWYIAWSDRMTEKELDEVVKFTYVGGGDGAMTRAQIIMHLVNHTSYHRGFAADLFFQIRSEEHTSELQSQSN